MNENDRGLSGVNYPENGKKWYQADFQEEQSRISTSVLDRESDILSAGVISGWEVSLSPSPGILTVSPGSGRDTLQRRLQSSASKEVSIPDGQTSIIVARHAWIDEDYFSTAQEKNSVHIPSIIFMAVSDAQANDIPLCRVSRNGTVISILADLRNMAKIKPTALSADSVKECSPDAEITSGKKIVLFSANGSIESDVTGSAAKLGGELPSFYSPSTHSHNLAELTERSYFSLTERPSSVGQLYFGIFAQYPESVLPFNGAVKARSLYPELMALLNSGALGTLVSDADWLAGACGGFSSGDGSTTFRLPDWQGIFMRFTGSNSVLKTANGSAYNGSGMLSILLDMMLGHLHAVNQRGDLIEGGPTSRLTSITNTQTQTGQTMGPISDGINGPPRFGNQNAPASVSLNAGIYFK